MTTPPIFCTDCTTLILKDEVCSTCGWVRVGSEDEQGQIAWQSDLNGRLGSPYVTPAAAGEFVFVPVEDSEPTTTVFALDAATGETRWTHALPAGRVVRHLFSTDKLLLIAPEDSRVLGQPTANLVALHAANGREAWRCAIPGHSLTPPVVVADKIFTISSNSTGYMIDAAAGEITQTIPGLPPWLPLQPLAAGELIYSGGRSGQLVTIDPSKGTVTPLFSLVQDNAWFDKPLAAAGKLILAANWNRRLYAITPPGEIAWEADLERGASSPPTAGQHAYIGIKRMRDEDGQRRYGVAAIDLADGTRMWFADAGRHVETPPLPVEEELFVTSRDGRMLAINCENGEIMWSTDLGKRPRTAPLQVGNLMIIGLDDGTVMAVTWQKTAVDWDALEEPEIYRREKDWMMAGISAALAENWVAAAEDYIQAQQPAYAARLFARAEAWAPAAAAFLAAREKEQAAEAFQLAGELATAAGLLEEMGQFSAAARLFETIGDDSAAAQAYEKAGMLAKAAPLFETSGDPARAADLYMQLERPAKAAGALAAAGRVSEAADILRQAGHPEQAAQLLEDAGQTDLAATLWKEQGREEDALRLYLGNHDYEAALSIAQGRNDWALIRLLAFDLDRFELEAQACLEMATDATGNASFDHYAAAGQALMRAARSLEQMQGGEMPREARFKAAEMWARAAVAFENGLEDEKLIRQCQREALRLRRWPELTIEVAAVRELVAGEYHTLLVKLINTGFGIANFINIRVLEDRFDGDADHTQHIRGMRPGAEQQLLLRVKPKEDAVGSAVPLDLELSFQLPNGDTKTRQVRGQVPVRGRTAGEATPSPLDPLAARPAINVFQESPEIDLHRATAAAPPGLRQKMTDYLSESEIKTICFDLELDYRLLPGPSLVDKIRDLIIFCERRKMIPALLAQCAQINGHIDWVEEASREGDSAEKG